MEYGEMTVADLRSLCGERGIAIPSRATKAQLRGWLEEYDLNNPIEVEAVPVEEEIIPRTALSIDAEAMQAAAVELTHAMDDAATALGEYGVDDEAIAEMAMDDIRVCEDGLAAALKEVDERRLELTRMLTEPKKAIDAKCKELTEPIKELAGRYADAREAVHMRGYRAQYEECCIANGIEALANALPFDDFIAMHPRWVARTANPVKTQEKIADAVEKAARDWETLRGLRNSMRFYADAEAEFFKTLDVQAAIKRNERRTEEQERVDAMNREREENERWRREQAQKAQEQPRVPDFTEVEPEPAAVPERPAEPARAPQGRHDGRRRYHFEAWMTDAELASFREWKNACGVGEGWTFRRVKEVA